MALTLVPVMGGVAIASLKELSLAGRLWWSDDLQLCFVQGHAGKMQMGKSVGKNMNAANLYAVMTIISSVLRLPLALALEGTNIVPTLAKIKEAGLINTLYLQTAASAIFYYLYNEVAFLTLDNVAPVTHALGNTIKRVVIILASVVWLGSTMTAQGAFGSVMAIGGVLLSVSPRASLSKCVVDKCPEFSSTIKWQIEHCVLSCMFGQCFFFRFPFFFFFFTLTWPSEPLLDSSTSSPEALWFL